MCRNSVDGFDTERRLEESRISTDVLEKAPRKSNSMRKLGVGMWMTSIRCRLRSGSRNRVGYLVE